MARREQLERILGLWFGFRARVDRRTYVGTGIGLAIAKYALDAAAVYAVAGRVWTPLDYLNPLLSGRIERLGGQESEDLFLLMGAWTLPFLWIAVSMSLRRALDAGRPPWLALMVMVPGPNYLVMLYLCLVHSRPGAGGAVPARDTESIRRLQSALQGVAAGVAIALGMVLVSAETMGRYGETLFYATPAVMGAVSGYLHNRLHARSLGSTVAVAALTALMAGGAILVFGLEGAVCLAIAFPLAFAMTLLGALIGRAIAQSGTSMPAQAVMIVLVLPFLSGVGEIQTRSPTFETVSAIEIDATPERVWAHVIGFTELPPPSELVFRSGVAYPLRARIDGRGVGAVRRCEFSTGAFVEPITRWDPPRALGFDVAAQPAPMQEWSPYGPIVTPHLYGYFRSVRGEFRLVPLPGGRTRLEGSTWYELDLAPRAYFALWSDALISRIHARVLAHVKRLSEAPEASAPGE